MRNATSSAALATLLVVIAACATDDAGATGETGTITPPVTTGFATVPPPSTAPPASSTSGPAPSDEVADDSGRTDGDAGSVTTENPTVTSTVAPSTAPPTSPAPTSPAPTVVPVDALEESSADEPSFDIGPSVDLDVDLARFPLDDAGIGAAPSDPAPGEGDDPVPTSGWAAVDHALEQMLIRSGNTAAAYAVSIDGDVVHTAAFGVRDPASGDPAEPDDRFRIASISKPITAIVALSLVDDGVVGLDEPVGRRIADHLGVPSISSATERLTLRQLLSHRTGLGKYQSTFFGGGVDDCEEAARRGLAAGAGGGGYVYSNMNYCLAGKLVEALTGQTYEQAVYTHLLTPLGISGMRLPPTVDPGPGEVQHRTTPGRNYMETLGAAGSWIASPTDLVTIFDALDLSTPGYKPLTQERVFEMVVPPGASYGDRGYGLGVISYGGGRFGHTGTIESTHAMLLNRGDGVTWAITVAGEVPSESTDLERMMDAAFVAGGFVDG